MAALPLYTGIYSGTTAYDAAGMANEHSDNGGHDCWVKVQGGDVLEVRFISAKVGRARNCPDCGTRSERKAPVTEGKKGVCRKPVMTGESHECGNCGDRIVESKVRKSGWSHEAAFIG